MLPRNILIFHLGALGDFILTWPLALAAARLFPQSRIFYVTHPDKGRLAERALNLESLSIEAGWHTLYAGPDALPAPSRQRLAGAHTLISFISTPDDPWTENARRIAPHANLLTLRPTPPADFPGHASQFILDQLRPHPALHAATGQILRSIAERGLGSRRTPGDSLLIHPGSGSRDKCWPLDHFITVAHRLLNAGHRVRILLGEVERERLDRASLARFDPATIVHPTTFIELLDEFLTARLLLANDSGPAHLAGILGLPTLCLFGPTDPDTWHPLGPRVQILRHQPLAKLPLDGVYSLLLRTLNPEPRTLSE